ncbi:MULTISPECIES: hypothetical protein [unclassified Endozoicomonas]|uniref:hypothetical protein n=1 Tax=unclassified Endozoicomonas TaxID=2644528 RepID=UPI003BB7F973
MIKLQHNSALFIAPVFLLLPLTTQSTPAKASTAPIEIYDAKDLGKIGREYPLNGTYQQKADIVVTKDYQSIGNDTHPFTGEYYGQCRTISGLSNCFIDTLKGSIRNLHFTGANITSQNTTGLAACVVDDTGTVSNIRAKDVHILTNGDENYAGIGGGLVKGTVGNTTAVNSRVETLGYEAHAGIGGGQVKGTVGNTTAVNSRVETRGAYANAGIGGGWVHKGKIGNTTAVNSTVETLGCRADAGIGGGQFFRGTVGNTTAVNSNVTTRGYGADAGIGGGQVYLGVVGNTTAVNSHVTTRNENACIDIGGGVVTDTVGNTTAVNSRNKTSGERAKAGIGAGIFARGAVVTNTTAVNSFINGNITNFGSISNDQLLCQKADLRVLTANCSSRTEFLDALDFSNSNACPVNAATVSTDTKESTATSESRAAKESTPTKASTPIEINYAGTLGKIGLHPDYPINGTYQQNATAATANATAATANANANANANATATPATAAPATAAPTTTATSPPRKLCSSLRGQTTGVQKRLIDDSDLVRERHCVVLSADPADDLSELIQQIPDNTVILLSSKTTSPTVAPVTGKPTVEYFIANTIVLKSGQEIIGAADDGFEIVIKLHDNFTSRYMIGVGAHCDNEFNFGETADNHIKHITFQPTGVNPGTQTHVIVHTSCYYGALSIENNVFYLPVWAAVNIHCSANLDASTNDLHTSPGLRFANNKVIGETIHTTTLSMIPEEAIFINLRNINNLSNKLEIIDNTFQGKISELAQIAIGSGSNINIFRNTAVIDNKGKTRRESCTGIETRRGGFALIGLSSSAYCKAPLINLAGNNINVTTTALTIYDELDLALTCNHFRGMTLWKVDNEYFSLKAVDPLPLADECPSSVSSTVDPATTSAPTLCQIVNSWTPINDSKATALTGLTNVEGQFYFDSAVCMTELQSFASSADTTPVTNALGVIASLAILLNL